MLRFAVLLLVLLTLPVRANLGETIEQCVKRYGKPIGFTEATDKSPFGTVGFKASNFTLIIFVYQNKEVGARVTKTDKSDFTDAEVKLIMNADSDPASPWTSTPSSDPTTQQWTRGDKASVIYDKAKRMLIFTSDAMAKAEDAAPAAPAAAPTPSAPTPPAH